MRTTSPDYSNLSTVNAVALLLSPSNEDTLDDFFNELPADTQRHLLVLLGNVCRQSLVRSPAVLFDALTLMPEYEEQLAEVSA